MENEERIIKYLDGDLKEGDSREFEKELARDPALARQVEEIRNLQELAREMLDKERDREQGLSAETLREIRQAVGDYKSGREKIPEEFGKELREAASAYFHKSQGGILRIQHLWYGLAALIIFGGILSVLLLKPFVKPTPAEIYAANFGVFEKTERITELTRSNNDFLFAVEVYESGDYERAEVLFNMLADSTATGQYARFYMGLTYMNLNQTDKAIHAFEQLLQEGAGDQMQAVRWYLALCYLKSDMPENSVALLEQIAGSGTVHKRDAKAILRSIR